MVNVWENHGIAGRSAIPEGPFLNEKEMYKALPKAKWNSEQGYWEDRSKLKE